LVRIAEVVSAVKQIAGTGTTLSIKIFIFIYLIQRVELILLFIVKKYFHFCI